MGNNQNSGGLHLHVAPEYDIETASTVVGLRILLDGFIINDTKMEYKAYAMLLELETGDPLTSSLDESIIVGENINLYVMLSGVEYHICFMVTVEMMEFCEEWKKKNFKITYWDQSPRYPTFSVN